MPFKGWHSRGYLPHFDSPEAIQLVTYRLSDSLPSEALERIALSDRPESLRDELLDRGAGACWLGRTDIADVVEQSLFVFDCDRYRLHAWTIMPNHVHVLFTVLAHATLSEIVGSWKKYTARQSNRLLGRSGRFWQADYWDRFIRNEAHFNAAVGYIDNNPVKAGLAQTASDWRWGSARFNI
ncbi:MAG TPA: transposase [Reyranella sp.]|nr:transposase [Reyranella sp.]